MKDRVKSARIVLWQERGKLASLQQQEIKLQTFMVVNFIGIIYFKTKKRKLPEEPNLLLEWCHDCVKKYKPGNSFIPNL